LAGGGIALLTLVIPIGSVVLDRGPSLGFGAANSPAILNAPGSESIRAGTPRRRLPAALADGVSPQQPATFRALSDP
jgi:hypothetical protein